MGRCYEFGVQIHQGCEQAMIVTSQGGACECTDCGATCPGKFAGCAAVVAIPGRVPPSVPDWALPGADPIHKAPQGASEIGPARRREAAPVEPLVAAPTLGERQEPASAELLLVVRQALGELRQEMVMRDAELLARLEVLVESEEQLRGQLEELVAKLDQLPGVIAGQIARFGHGTAQFFLEMSTELGQIRPAVEGLAGAVRAFTADGAGTAPGGQGWPSPPA